MSFAGSNKNKRKRQSEKVKKRKSERVQQYQTVANDEINQVNSSVYCIRYYNTVCYS